MKVHLITSLAITALLSLSVHALEADINRKVSVRSDSQRASIKDDTIIYTGNVQVTQGTMEIRSHELHVLNASQSGKQTLVASGKPARFSQMLDDGSVMDARASEIHYKLADRNLTLKGDAQLSQQDSVIRAQTINYNLARQEMQAESSKNSQVTTTFIPEQIQSQINEQRSETNNNSSQEEPQANND